MPSEEIVSRRPRWRSCSTAVLIDTGLNPACRQVSTRAFWTSDGEESPVGPGRDGGMDV